MGLDHFGLTAGKVASLVVLDAADPVEAIRLRADRLCVVARGKVVAERERLVTRLSIDGRPPTVSRRRPRHLPS
jgi:cytosine deaminase